MIDDNRIIVAGGGGALLPDKAMLRRIRGSVWDKVDARLFVIMTLSILAHGSLIITINRMKLPPAQPLKIEEISDRFARLIIEKPIPKEQVKKQVPQEAGAKSAAGSAETAPEQAEAARAEKKKAEQVIAQKNVAARVAKVENKIRTVGVLGLLTGTGATAKGPSVVDVLGSHGNRKEKFQDLEAALETSAGLIKTGDANVLNRRVVQSKEVVFEHRTAEIADLLDVSKTATKDLVKTGNIIIRPPESIEGAASSDAKRDDKAIGDVVNKNRIGIKMTYEKFLKRDPNLAGKITVRFTIAADGTVIKVLILENTTGSTEFEQELIRKIKMWRFEAVAEGDVSVTYPFLFNPS